MKGHFIVAGFGTVGRNVVEQLEKAGKQVVCIDSNPEVFEGYEGTCIVGESARTQVLERAELANADTLVVCAGSDAFTAFIILEARSLNPDLTILARAELNENVDKLYMAGADFVMPLVTTASRMLVRFAVAPHISEFVNRLLVGRELEIADARIPKGHNLVGRTMMEAGLRRRYGISVVAIMREGSVISTPSANEIMKEGDILVFIGESRRMTDFLKVLHQE